MNDLQKEFIRQSVAELQSLSEQSQSENLSTNFLHDCFRKIHSIKGTSQVFNLKTATNLAHTLENLLVAVSNNSVSEQELTEILPEGFHFLAQTLEEKNFQIPAEFNSKLQNFHFEAEKTHHKADFPEDFPAALFAQLSAGEKAHLTSLFENGSCLTVLEVGFEAAKFVADFKVFRQNLEEKGEIIASFPSAKFSAERKIGFQIIFATNEEIDEIISQYSAQIVFHTSNIFSSSLEKMFARLINHGKNIAARLGKNVDFKSEITAEISSTATLKLLFEILLHLIKNAVDHAFDEKGKVEIILKQKENALFLSILDNGTGLDLTKIKAKAIAKNLISMTENLSEAALSEMIFLPEFSTTEAVSEISGRGIGLDAVKTLIENAGGKISVKSIKEKGTTFEIFLPKES